MRAGVAQRDETSVEIERRRIEKYFDCARLNLRVAQLAISNQWLSQRDFAAGYDEVAPDYDEAWLRYLKPVTAGLVDRLPQQMEERILDLGCGNGGATGFLSSRYPTAPITGVDISEKMLSLARARACGSGAEFVCADMLEFLDAHPRAGAGLIFSAWAIGYSHPARIFDAASRVLKRGGILAFVVNCSDTLAPVFKAFRQCMARFPGRVQRAAWLHFPKNLASLERMIQRSGFEILWSEAAAREVGPPESSRGGKLAWLRKTGVLAGFDAMLPLHGPVGEYFDSLLRNNPEPLRHRYAAVIATLK